MELEKVGIGLNIDTANQGDILNDTQLRAKTCLSRMSGN